MNAVARATGVVVWVETRATDSGTRVGVRLRVRVRPEGGAPFDHDHRAMIERTEVPSPGDLVDVTYEPGNPKRVTVVCDRARRPTTAPPPLDARSDGPTVPPELRARRARRRRAFALALALEL
ncbi:MAG TPA: DUF3592 domain-containing protein, partial [Minicystis sp.]|nr:DUF3592 domain-containing protein [Minicystis sp.]